MNVELKIQQFVVASFQSKVWNSSLFQQDRPGSGSQGQGGSSIPSHALVVLGHELGVFEPPGWSKGAERGDVQSSS